MKYTITDQDSINETLKKCHFGDIIYLKAGIYTEKVEILTPGVTLLGEDAKKTILTNHDFYHKIMEDYNECNTFRTYTCYVGAKDVRIENLTIENSSTPSERYGQAVALHVNETNFECKDCILRSAQDTLFTGPLPENLLVKYKGFLKDDVLKDGIFIETFTNCTIYGDVDFIFGGATVLFYNCDIISIHRTTKNSREPSGYIAAPSHAKDLPYGFLFYQCNLTCEAEVDHVYLARPWRDYGISAFIECNLGPHIYPSGFNKWGNTSRDKTARFFEYSPNADTSMREPWAKLLSKEEAKAYVDAYMAYCASKRLENSSTE